MGTNRIYKSDKATTRLNIIGLFLYKLGRFLTLTSYRFKKSDACKVKYYKNKHGRLFIDTTIDGKKINLDIMQFINQGYTFHLSDFEKDELFFNIQNLNDRRNRYYAIFSDDGINILDENEALIHENLTALDLFEDRRISNALTNEDYHKALKICKTRHLNVIMD